MLKVQLLAEIVKEAKKRDGEYGRNTCSQDDFMEFLERAKGAQQKSSEAAVHEINGLKFGLAHFFQKVLDSRISFRRY